jgi:hypothetical protein
LAFLTMQLLTERPKEMVMESDKPGLKKGWTWVDYVTIPNCVLFWMSVKFNVTVECFSVFQKIWMDSTFL